MLTTALTSNEINKQVRDHNVGNSDYSKHTIQPWDLWIQYHLNPFDAVIVKRILRKKKEAGMSATSSRIRQLQREDSWEKYE